MWHWNTSCSIFTYTIPPPRPSIFLCNNEFTILLQRNKQILAVGRFKLNQLHFEGIILKTEIFRFFRWIFTAQESKDWSKEKLSAFFKQESLWRDFWYQQCWFSEETKLFTDFSLLFISFGLLGNDDYDKKAWDVHLFQIRMYSSEVHYFFIFLKYKDNKRGPDSSVGIASDYGLDGPGIESWWGEIFCLSRPALGPTQPPVKWVPGLSRW